MQPTKKPMNKMIVRFAPWIGAILCVAIILGIILWMYSHHKRFKPDAETFRYWMGEQIAYDDSLALSHDNGTTTFLFKEEKLVSDGTPIVYESKDAFLLPLSMGYLNPNSNEGVKRVNYFATVKMEGQIIEIKQNEQTTQVRGGFLYDGDGTYVFLEPTTLAVENMTYELGVLSYVKYYYKDSIEVYDLTQDQYYFISITNGNINVDASGYSLNVATGVLSVEDSQRILFSDIDAMGVLK